MGFTWKPPSAESSGISHGEVGYSFHTSKKQLTNELLRTTVLAVFRGIPVVKRSKWVFLLLLVPAMICTSAVPMVDLPETAFNEMDTPVNQTPPDALLMQISPPP